MIIYSLNFNICYISLNNDSNKFYNYCNIFLNKKNIYYNYLKNFNKCFRYTNIYSININTKLLYNQLTIHFYLLYVLHLSNYILNNCIIYKLHL